MKESAQNNNMTSRVITRPQSSLVEGDEQMQSSNVMMSCQNFFELESLTQQLKRLS